MKIAIYLIFFYLLYRFLIKPFFLDNKRSNGKGTFDDRRRTKVNYTPPDERDIREGEYIDYEEVKENQ